MNCPISLLLVCFHVDRFVDTIVHSVPPCYNRGGQELWPINLPNWGPKKTQGPPLSLPRSPSTSGRSAAAPDVSHQAAVKQQPPWPSAYLTFFLLFLFSFPPRLCFPLPSSCTSRGLNIASKMSKPQSTNGSESEFEFIETPKAPTPSFEKFEDCGVRTTSVCCVVVPREITPLLLTFFSSHSTPPSRMLLSLRMPLAMTASPSSS